MPNQLTNTEGMRFTPSTMVSLFVLDGTVVGMNAPFYFCDGVNSSYQSIVFNGITYTPFPIVAIKFGFDGTGKPVRPTIRVSNINGFISQYLLAYQNLIGARLIRRRVYARFLDAANWPNNVNPFGNPDPTAVNRKVGENSQYVEWELASLFETDGIKLPRRQIIGNVCGFKFRDAKTCGYSGAPLTDSTGKLFGAGGYGLTLNNRGQYVTTNTYNVGDYVFIYSSIPQFVGLPVYYVCMANGITGSSNAPAQNTVWVPEVCSHTVAGCKLRFAGTYQNPLRFGGMPGVNQSPYVSSHQTLSQS